MFTLRRGLILLVLCLSGIALYRGWVSFSRPSGDPQDHKVNVEVSVDPHKVKADVEKVEEKISEGIARAKRAKDGVNAPAAK